MTVDQEGSGEMFTGAVAVAELTKVKDLYAEARRRLKDELETIASNVRLMNPDRPAWKPLLDSRRVVATVLVLENLFPGIKIPPDKVVKKGGYNDVGVAVKDVIRNHKRFAAEAVQKKRVSE